MFTIRMKKLCLHTCLVIFLFACKGKGYLTKTDDTPIFKAPTNTAELGKLPSNYPLALSKFEPNDGFAKLKYVDRWVRLSDLKPGQKSKDIFYMIRSLSGVDATPRETISTTIETGAGLTPYCILHLYTPERFIIQEPYDRENFFPKGQLIREAARKFRNFYGTYRWSEPKSYGGIKTGYLHGKVTEEDIIVEDQSYALPYKTSNAKKVERELECEYFEGVDKRFWCHFKNDSPFKEWILTRSPFEIPGYNSEVTEEYPPAGMEAPMSKGRDL